MIEALRAPAYGVFAAAAAGGPLEGRAAMAGVFLLVLLWLLVLPKRLLGETPGARIPWWRHARFWAGFVAVVQIAVYLWWG